jgi:hypothetical protein
VLVPINDLRITKRLVVKAFLATTVVTGAVATATFFAGIGDKLLKC